MMHYSLSRPDQPSVRWAFKIGLSDMGAASAWFREVHHSAPFVLIHVY